MTRHNVFEIYFCWFFYEMVISNKKLDTLTQSRVKSTAGEMLGLLWYKLNLNFVA